MGSEPIRESHGRVGRTRHVVSLREKGQVETRPGLFGQSCPCKTTSRCNYFLAVGGGGASLVCAQAPSPKALAITTAIMITFKNFNLYRLLSQQVAPVCLDREQPRGNAFLKFFERVTTGHQIYFE
jgi:hypothetical protein